MMDSQVKCCGCVDLQTGCTVIGTIELIALVLSIGQVKFIGLLWIASSVLLIIGAQKRNFNLMWPWLIFAVIDITSAGLLLLLIVFDVDKFIQMMAKLLFEPEEDIEALVPYLIAMIIIVALVYIYEMYIVLSFKKQIIQQSIFNTMRA